MHDLRPSNFDYSTWRRMSEEEAEHAVLDLVRAMGEGDIVEGLGKLEMLEVLDDMRCDWMEILEHGLPS